MSAFPSGRRTTFVRSAPIHVPDTSLRFASWTAGTSSYMWGVHPASAARRTQAAGVASQPLLVPGELIGTALTLPGDAASRWL
ncbi:hypothetical protein GCM10010515_49990 [Streptomyces fructofermentans]|uniref:Uncharacterized protein n=1 Tax=Streptomyces fructofermentans TaxID=152141 RepID=A0A918KU84_9ACTN|nr:hypothetical protein GCM10010515_49990 [Streptomyces fructofermentans]